MGNSNNYHQRPSKDVKEPLEYPEELARVDIVERYERYLPYLNEIRSLQPYKFDCIKDEKLMLLMKKWGKEELEKKILYDSEDESKILAKFNPEKRMEEIKIQEEKESLQKEKSKKRCNKKKPKRKKVKKG